MDKKHKGAHSEMMASAYLLGLGYEVYRNVSQHGAIDLIAIGNDETLHIDVKTVTPGTKDGFARPGQSAVTPEQSSLGVVLLEVVGGVSCNLIRDPRVSRSYIHERKR